MNLDDDSLAALSAQIKSWGKELGFAEIRIADADLSHTEAGFQQWLDAGFHGDMRIWRHMAPNAVARLN